jgi:Phage tail protein
MSSSICVTNDVQIGNLVLNTIDSDGVQWVVSELDGWWTLPEPEINDAARGWDDGSYMTIGRYTPRIINLSGAFIPPSPSLVSKARASLISNINLVRQSTWFMTHESDYTKAAEVQLSGLPMISTTSISGKTEFAVGLRAPDPRKHALAGRTPPGWYMASRTGAGGLVVTNSGNYLASPILTVTGPSYGPVNVVNHTTGDVLEIRNPINGGSTLVVDCQDRSVTLDGSRNKRNYLEWDTDWIELTPGDNSLEVIDAGVATPNAATLTVQWRHSWIG